MVLPGHLAAGYLTTYAVLFVSGIHFAYSQELTLLCIGTLLGDAPDSDIAYNFLKKKTLSSEGIDQHRDYVTHTAPIWLISGLALYALGHFALANPFVEILGLLLWLCPWSHLLCDSFFVGIRWLWPFSNKYYALSRAKNIEHTGWKDFFMKYFKTPHPYIEMGLVIVTLFVLLL